MIWNIECIQEFHLWLTELNLGHGFCVSLCSLLQVCGLMEEVGIAVGSSEDESEDVSISQHKEDT
jgi:hypothetical protein